MAIDIDAIDAYGDSIEEGYIEHGGGGGGKKKKAFGSEHRSEKVKTETIKAAKEGEQKGEALTRVMGKVTDILKSDEDNMDAREVKAYFEWLRLALMCNGELCNMKKGSYGDQELALEMLMKGSDLEENFVRSQGAGGQNVNKVSSAVQLKHIPSGFFVKVQESRDQFQNRPIARDRLREQLCKHLGDWDNVIGGRSEKEVMAEVFEGVLEKQGEIKGVRRDVLKRVALDLREGRNL